MSSQVCDRRCRYTLQVFSLRYCIFHILEAFFVVLVREGLLWTKDIFWLLLKVTQLGFLPHLYRWRKMVPFSHLVGRDQRWRKWSLFYQRRKTRGTHTHFTEGLDEGIYFYVSSFFLLIIKYPLPTHDILFQMQNSTKGLWPNGSLFWGEGRIKQIFH